MKKSKLTLLLLAANIGWLSAQEEAKETQLKEVIITSLGIKKEKTSSANAIQEISGKALNVVRTPNPLDNLAGKVAGIQITSGVTGVAGSTRIVVRGEKSLNINNNSPLFIVDGMPISNRIYGVGGEPTNQGDLPTDYGSGASDINSEDIESINVLKGNAAALYGSRAANGVILITTKKGNRGEKLSLSFASSLMMVKPILPEFQTEYGQGGTNANGRFQYLAGNGENYGPRFNPNLYLLQEGSPQFASGEKIPFVHRYNLKDIFKNGSQIFNNISLQGYNDNISYRLSYSNSNNQGYIPNTDLLKNTLSGHTEYKLSNNTKIATSLNFVNTKSNNVPVAGYGSQGLMYVLYWNHLNNDLKWAENYWKEEGVSQNYSLSWADNPYFIANENINGFNRNRFFGSARLDHKINENFALLLRTGLDYQNELRTSRRALTSHRYKQGMYRLQGIDFQEMNTDLLLTYNKKYNDWDFDVLAGVSRMDRKYHESFLQSNKLLVHGIYSLNNTGDISAKLEENNKRRTNAVLGSASVGYKKQIFVEVTSRNDWSSTLPSANNSYFYPSVAASWVVNNTFSLNKNINLLKLRANWGKIGNDTDPESLSKKYPSGFITGSITNPTSLVNANLLPEISLTKEIGVELLAFKKRIDLQANYYINTTKNQIIKPSISASSGYNSIAVNAGEIENKGLEVFLGIKPVVTEHFMWDMSINYSSNIGTVKSLYQDLNSFIIAQGPANVTIEARPGGRMGDIYGYKLRRTAEGQVIFQNGLPLLSAQKELIGNYNPDFMLGFRNHLSYKNISLSFLFDIRKGGTIYSYTQAIGGESGVLPYTLEGREEGIIGQGVKLENGIYVPNEVLVYPEKYYYSGGYYDRSNAETNSYDASFIKLRELSVAYDFPKKLISKLKMNELQIAIVGRNLLRWTRTPQFLDPESMALSGGTLLPGMDVMQYPSAASFGVNLNVKF